MRNSKPLLHPFPKNLKNLKDSDEYNYNRLVDLRELVKQKKETFEAVNKRAE